jgi:hypothetical protein
MEVSVQRTGKPYQEVHEWIDHPDFKIERHDISRVFEFARMFTEKYGEVAAQEYVQHLAVDIQAKIDHLAEVDRLGEDVQAVIDKNLIFFGVKNPKAD